jgi:hypothetical protein
MTQENERRVVSGDVVERNGSHPTRDDDGFDWSKFRGKGAQAATVAYAGYKWFEDHADDVERFSLQAIARSKGKKFGRAVVPTAHVLIGAARWVQERNKPAKRLPKGKRG